jgi:hypothetical protein
VEKNMLKSLKLTTLKPVYEERSLLDLSAAPPRSGRLSTMIALLSPL